MFVFLNRIGPANMQPDLVSRFCVQRDDFADRSRLSVFPDAVDQSQVDVSVVENWRRRHPELNTEFAIDLLQIFSPHLFAFDRVTNKNAVAHHRPDMFAIGAWRWAG